MKKNFQQALDSNEAVTVKFKPESFEVIRVGRSNIDAVARWVRSS